MSWRSQVAEVFDPTVDFEQEDIQEGVAAFLGTTGVVPAAGGVGSPSLLREEEDIPPLAKGCQPMGEQAPARVSVFAAPKLAVGGSFTASPPGKMEAEGRKGSKRAAEDEAPVPPAQKEGKAVPKKRVKRTVSRTITKEHRMDRESFVKFMAESTESLDNRKQGEAAALEREEEVPAETTAEGAKEKDFSQTTGGLIAQIDDTSALAAIPTAVGQRQGAEDEVIFIEDSGEQNMKEVEAFVDSMLASGGPDQETAQTEGQRVEDEGPITGDAPEEPADFVGRGGAEMDEGLTFTPPVDLSRAQGAQETPGGQEEAAGALGAEGLQEGHAQAEVTLVDDQVAEQTEPMLHATGAEGPGPSAAPIEELMQSGEQEVRTTGKSSAADALPFSDEQIKLLKELVGHVLKEQLTGSWALPVFKTSVEEALAGYALAKKRQEEQVEVNKGVEGKLNGIAATHKDFEERLHQCELVLPIVTTHGREHTQMRTIVNRCDEVVSENSKAVSYAKDDVSKALAEFEFIKSENFKMGTELDLFKRDLNREADGVAARLENLEGYRREARLRTGPDDSTEANRLKMEGINFCVLAQAQRGLFPRELLRDESFMRMIPDRDGLLLALERGERERRNYDTHRGQVEYRQHYRDSPPRRYPQDRREGPSGGQR